MTLIAPQYKCVCMDSMEFDTTRSLNTSHPRSLENKQSEVFEYVLTERAAVN
jgi:hypothetical protein